MEEAFKKLDSVMKKLSVDLIDVREDNELYDKIIKQLAEIYQAYQVLLSLDPTRTYYFKYADLNEVVAILTNAGYLEQQTKTSNK